MDGNQGFVVDDEWYSPSDTDCEGSFAPVTAFDDGHFAAEVGAWSVEYFMGMAMVHGAGVGMADTVVGVGMVAHHDRLGQKGCWMLDGKKKEDVNESMQKRLL